MFSSHGNAYDLVSALSADSTLEPHKEETNGLNPTFCLPGSKIVFPSYTML